MWSLTCTPHPGEVRFRLTRSPESPFRNTHTHRHARARPPRRNPSLAPPLEGPDPPLAFRCTPPRSGFHLKTVCPLAPSLPPCSCARTFAAPARPPLPLASPVPRWGLGAVFPTPLPRFTLARPAGAGGGARGAHYAGAAAARPATRGLGRVPVRSRGAGLFAAAASSGAACAECCAGGKAGPNRGGCACRAARPQALVPRLPAAGGAGRRWRQLPANVSTAARGAPTAP